ncbi:AEC family transporter [Thiohalorhabdus sp.]|uniref:AEC family transporter n=1 Tax=Thiohalorhabdus sp. TaxID=3094134 RepID=UPI002FC36180
MVQVMIQMAALIGLGVVWRWLQPGGLDADRARYAVATLVYYLLLPALILSVLWEAPLGLETGRIALSAAAGVVAVLGLTWLVLRPVGVSRRLQGTLLLAAAWPNATYLGLPVLEATYGEWARRIAIQYDLFACLPLLMTVGVLIARHHGNAGDPENPLLTLVKVPPLWAAALAATLNVGGVAPPPPLADLLADIGDSVPALMLLALGMGLTWGDWRWSLVPAAGLVVVLQLAVQPALVAGLGAWSGLTGEPWQAVALEAAMPTMILGVVLCDRYGLDTGLYAKAVTLSTVLSLATLPAWFRILA